MTSILRFSIMTIIIDWNAPSLANLINMQYSVQVSSKPRFKFTEEHSAAQEQNIEESKSHPSDSSSLVTEEDTSGNPLPPEIVEIRRKNKKMQKNLTNGMMNFKSSNREAHSSVEKSKSKKPKNKNRPIAEKKETEPQETLTKQDATQVILGNDALKNLLDKILVLQNDFNEARTKLVRNEQEINKHEEEYSSLKKSLQSVEDEIQEKGGIIGCNCRII